MTINYFPKEIFINFCLVQGADLSGPTFTYKTILSDPDISGLNKKQANLLTFTIQYSIAFLIVKNDKRGNLKGLPLYGKNNNLSHKFF